MESSSDREQQIAVLEAATSASKDSADFDLLLGALELPLAYKDILVDAIAAGRWKQAKRPLENLRRTVERLVFAPVNKGKKKRIRTIVMSPDEMAWKAEANETSDAIRNVSGVWTRGGGREARRDEYPAVSLLSRVPRDLRTTLYPSADIIEHILEPWDVGNWDVIAERAGLDAWEKTALDLILDGQTLHSSLKYRCETDEERRLLEAAWKRFQRTKLKKIKEIFEASQFSTDF